jgi:hypothetical protein
LTLLSVILAVLLVGCSSGTTMRTKPPRPELEIHRGPQGGMCLNGQDTRELLHYIRRLERGYK